MSRSLTSMDVEIGSDISFSCQSSGGIPTPNISLLVGDSLLKTGPGPTLSHTFTAEESMHEAVVRCEAENEHGRVHDNQTLTLYSEYDLQLQRLFLVSFTM